MAHADRNLGALGEVGGGAHFLGHGGGQVAEALLVFGQDAAQDFQALLAGGLAPGREGLAGGHDGLVDVSGAAKRDLAADVLGGGVDDVEGLLLDRIDPLAVDVELQVLAHGLSLTH